ncbi:type II toxin-antitoxin system PemK/MazF family toxin, partial [Candidatus Microgenomates bacterium]|nr:type II toxin-antitoxin system PemK/MazF family toxin [Candidatus Microgenomates bacterium]
MAQVKRGEFWLINLDPSFGREIHKKRPALVISVNAIHQKTPHVIVIPASSQVPEIVGLEMVLVGEREDLHKKSVLLPLFIRSI